MQQVTIESTVGKNLVDATQQAVLCDEGVACSVCSGPFLVLRVLATYS
jgi:hypothetical protein